MYIPTKEFFAIVIGAGGAGMRAALEISQQGISCALISKVFPTRSHTVSAQGGITVALSNVHEDDWQWHMYDTVKGSDYLGDQNAIEYMCKEGPESVLELERMGMPFSRLNNGRIYQRPFGGQSVNYGRGQAARTASAADRTGHALLHTLYQQNIRNHTTIFSEWYAIDLVKNQDGKILGCLALCIETGEIIYFKARATILATGGAGRVYQFTTNAHINTGDGLGMALRAGIPAQDMEMWQFHPTGIIGIGILISEACRGEGGYLLNKNGERFMTRYAPNAKDLASRDVISRSIMTEIYAGRGFEGKHGSYVELKLYHLKKKTLELRLPGILELARTFAHIEPTKESIPVIPTCHYMMGGIPTNINGEVISLNNQGDDILVPGLFAIGEVACVSVHGANRLGGNSLLDIIVFGRSTGLHLKKIFEDGGDAIREATSSDLELALSRYIRWNKNIRTSEKVSEIKKSLQSCMQDNFSVFRTHTTMMKGLKELQAIRERLQYASLNDTSHTFNMERIECLELDNLVETAYSTAMAANFRTESRGAHNRDDYPYRDDNNWLCHTLYFSKNDMMRCRKINMRPISRPAFPPKQRIY